MRFAEIRDIRVGYSVIRTQQTPFLRRRGARQDSPNGPDEGMSKTAKLDCEGEANPIFSPVGGFARFAVVLSHVSTLLPYTKSKVHS